jgi:PAS domain-containing protein
VSETRELLDGTAVPESFGTLGLIQAIREVVEGLAALHDAAGTDPRLAADDHLRRAREELNVVEEEIAAQLAEAESVATARREERLLTARLLATLPVPLLTTDVNGAIRDANVAAAELLGVDLKDLPRKPLFAYVETASRRRGRSLLRDAVRTGQTAEGVLVIRPRGGDDVPCQVTLAPMPGAGTTCPEAAPDADGVRWVVQPSRSGRNGVTAPDSQATLVELCRLGIGEADLRTLLCRITRFACEGLRGVDGASIVLGDPLNPDMLVSSCSLAQTGDGAQYRAGAGPSFQAQAQGRPVGTADLSRDARWPRVTSSPGGQTVHGCLALPLVLDGATIGVLALYRRRPGLAEDLEARARPYVAAAQAVVRDSRLIDEMTTVRRQLESALTSRAIIDQAKGIVMVTRRCDADQAFALLTRMSNSGNRKLRDLAKELVEHASCAEPDPRQDHARGAVPRTSQHRS